MDEQRVVIEQRRQRCGDRHVAVGDLQELGHQEGGRTHHRRHQLPAGGGHRLDRGCHMPGIAAAPHQRNGQHADRRDIAHRAAGNHAEQAGGGDRDLGRAAAIAAHQSQRNVGEEIGAAGGEQEIAEEHEGDDDRRRHQHRQAEHAAGIPDQIERKLLQADRQALQRTRHVLAERRVGEEHQHHDGERPADRAAQGFDHHRNGDEADDQPVERAQRHVLRQHRKTHRDIEAEREAESRQQPVVPGDDGARGAAARGLGEIDQRHGEPDHAGQELLVVQQQPEGVAIELQREADRAEREQAGAGKNQPAGHH